MSCMSGRSVRFRNAAASTAVAVVILTVALERPMAGASSVRPIPLNILITISTSLPSVSRQVLTTEAERIWAREGVEIEWSVPGLASESSDAPLRVMVVTRPTPTVRTKSRWPVAELIPEASPRALAIASITSAQRVVDEAARGAVLAPGTSAEYRLGLVLGRAVAHEIGHFLLATGTHAENGLMRASVDAREFAAMGGEAFRLDGDASRWLRQTWDASPTVATMVRAGGCSYAHQAGSVEPRAGSGALLLASPGR
jgi:hypothetical protein